MQQFDLTPDDFDIASIMQIEQTKIMELINVPPSWKLEQERHSNSLQRLSSQSRGQVTQPPLTPLIQYSSQGFYSRVISAKQLKRGIKGGSNERSNEDTSNGNTSLEKDSQMQTNLISQMDPTSQSLYTLLVQKEQQIDSLQRKFAIQRNISSKQKNRQGLNFMQGYSDKTIEELRSLADIKCYDEKQKEKVLEIIKDTISFVQGLNQIFRQQQQQVQLCTYRLQQSEKILKLLERLNEETQVRENDLFTLRRILTQLQDSLTSQQMNELDANSLYRDLQKCQMQVSKQQSQIEKLTKRCEHSEQAMEKYKYNFQIQHEENNKVKRFLRKEKDSNAAATKRVTTLEQRIEILRGSEAYRRDKDSLRNIIDDLIKENEQNKRKAFQKNQEVIRLEQLLSDFKEKNQNLARKSQTQERQLRMFGFNSYDLNANPEILNNLNQQQKFNDKDDEQNYQECLEIRQYFEQTQDTRWADMFNKGKPPKKLDFKFWPLKPEFKKAVDNCNKKMCSYNLVSDSGAKYTLEQINRYIPQGERLNYVYLFMDQFMQFKYLGEKINSLLNILNGIFDVDTIEDLLYECANLLPAIFQCQNVNLWLIDQQKSTFYTYTEKRVLIHALVDKNGFYELIKSQCPVFIKSDGVQQVTMYRDSVTDEDKMFTNFLLVPIKLKNRMIGLISGTNFPDVQSTLQNSTYAAIVLSFSLAKVIKKLSHIKLLNYQIKYKNILFDSMTELCQQQDHYNFQKCLEKQANMLFGITATKFYYFRLKKLITYQQKGVFNEFSPDLSVAGLVARTCQNLILPNILEHEQFHQRIDIKSSMPVFVIAICTEIDYGQNGGNEINPFQKTCIGVLEIVLNSKAQLTMHNKEYDASLFFGASDTMQSMALMFSEVISIAYDQLIRKKI